MNVFSFSVFCPPFVYLSRKDPGTLLFLFGVLGLLLDKPAAARSSPNACAMSFTASAFCVVLYNFIERFHRHQQRRKERERE
jgi:hypothetical protein